MQQDNLRIREFLAIIGQPSNATQNPVMDVYKNTWNETVVCERAAQGIYTFTFENTLTGNLLTAPQAGGWQYQSILAGGTVDYIVTAYVYANIYEIDLQKKSDLTYVDMYTLGGDLRIYVDIRNYTTIPITLNR